MATEKYEECVYFAQNVTGSLEKACKSFLSDNRDITGRVKLVKRNKDLIKGDFQILIVGVKATELQAPELEESLFQWLQQQRIPVTAVTRQVIDGSKVSLILHLSRKEVLSSVLSDVHVHRHNYGINKSRTTKTDGSESPSNSEGSTLTAGLDGRARPADPTDSAVKHVILNCTCMSHLSDQTIPSLNWLRSVLLTEHVQSLLTSNGYNVTKTRYPTEHSEKYIEFLQRLGIQYEQNDATKSSGLELITECYNYIKDYILKPLDEDSAHPREYIFDLESYMNDMKVPQGKDGYDTSITTVKVCENSSPSYQIGSFNTVISELIRKVPTPSDICIIHVTSHDLEFSQQQVSVLLKLLQTTHHQFHQIHGSVKAMGHDGVSAEHYLSLRRKQLEEACQMKYGETVQGVQWEDLILSLTTACVKFDILSTQSKSQLKLNVDDTDLSCIHATKGGVFVMYNYARLAMLLHKYQTSVEQGLYPSLPALTDTDFSLLKEEEEWSLLFNYIWSFPELVRSTVGGMKEGTVRIDLHTHKVAQFLMNLSHDLSSYYSRVHILGEPRPHLLPLMFARLHLLKAVKQVIENGCHMMGIQPISQL